MTARPLGRLGSAATLITSVLFVASTALADPGATITKTRWGKTARGETRVVFELDRSVAWNVTVDPAGLSVEIRLTGAAPQPDLGPMTVRDERVDAVTIRRDGADVVAAVTSAGKPLRVKSFELGDPPRVVLDLGLREPDAGAAPKAPAKAETVKKPPAPAAKTEAAKPKTPQPAPAEPKASKAAPEKTPKIAEAPRKPKTPERAAPTPAAAVPATPAPRSAQEDFADLMMWLQELDGRVETLSASRSEREQARGRRSLAYFLAERGITREAEHALAASLASRERDRATAQVDSLFLAELRVEIGDSEGAVAIADDLVREMSSARELLRLARVYSESHRPDAAGRVLEDTLDDLKGDLRNEGLLLLAQSHWDQRDPESALPILQSLTKSEADAGETYVRALILQADCLWAVGRTSEARLRYERVARRDLPAEEASWVTLQLGNVARREGRLDDAKVHYRAAMTRWPTTFYASQAGWFLRVVEEIDSAQRTESEQGRG